MPRKKIANCPYCGAKMDRITAISVHHPDRDCPLGSSLHFVVNVDRWEAICAKITNTEKVIARGLVSDYELPYNGRLTIFANEPESKRSPIMVRVRVIREDY